MRERRLPVRSRLRLRRLYRQRLRFYEVEGRTRLEAQELASFDVYGGDTLMVYPDGIARPDAVGLLEAERVWFAGLEGGEATT